MASSGSTNKSSRRVYADFSPLVAKSKASSKIVEPAGFDLKAALGRADALAGTQTRNDEADTALRTKKAWEVAVSPGKSLPMQAFMAWMSGTSVSIFSILITGMILMSPLRAIMSVQQTFAGLERAAKGTRLDLTMQKAAFVAINLAGILFGVYRLSIMGLLPTTSSDWLAFLPPKEYMEYSA
ncbi:hypothetical protein H4R20_003046 [Coemansia guatemalensis]|uniref:ER membrane protein complex subunit 4 n=1 Tax=Coemansia guatemalensis TaxID=2761395 RepID=A0A9W8HYV3_9FUNG|nr:hypothetical protein H4R20_003046 [Coemansia guatemalensis]